MTSQVQVFSFLVVLITFKVAIGGRMVFQSTVQSGEGLSSRTAAASRPAKARDAFNMSKIVSFTRAFGRGQDPGGALPESICHGKVDDMYQFSLDDRLGRGGFGTVYKATLGGKRRALKQSRYEVGNRGLEGNFDPVELEPMRLKLPFIADVEHVFNDAERGNIWIGTRLYEGGNLWERLRNKPFKLPEIRMIGAQIAYGLWQLHQTKLIYGDLKPENVLLVDGKRERVPRLVLSDFGLVSRCPCKDCAHAGEGKEFAAGACSNEAQGSPDWMSPSIARLLLGARRGGSDDDEYGYEVDWWAFGVVMSQLFDPDHEMYEGSGAEGLMRDIIEGRPRMPKKFPWPLRRLVEKTSSGRAYQKLESQQSRTAMASSNPANHPILSDAFWLDKDHASPEEINTFWDGICRKYSLYPDKCGADLSVSQYLAPLCDESDRCSKVCDNRAVHTASVCEMALPGFKTHGNPDPKVCEAIQHAIDDRQCCDCLFSDPCDGASCIFKVCGATDA